MAKTLLEITTDVIAQNTPPAEPEPEATPEAPPEAPPEAEVEEEKPVLQDVIEATTTAIKTELFSLFGAVSYGADGIGYLTVSYDAWQNYWSTKLPARQEPEAAG